MILIGHSLIPHVPFACATSPESVAATPPNSVVMFVYADFRASFCRWCVENRVKFAIQVTSIRDAIVARSLGASYLICDQELALITQKVADNYLFDTKILAIIENDSEIEYNALNEIDGVIYKEVIHGIG